VIARLLAPATLIFVLIGCSGDSDSRRTDHEAGVSTVRSATTLATTSAENGERTCPLTLPNRSTPSDARDWPARDSYGNGKLWTLFWPHNLVIANTRFVQEDGAIRMKWPWWRGVRGELKVEGRTLGGEAPPLTAEVPPYYGSSGFQPTAIFFPTEGCWEVTGRVGNAQLTFVTLVVKASSYGLEEKRG
jgi:hypothetical protein